MSVKNERPTFRALVELYETHFVYSMNQKLTLWKVLYKPLSSTLWNVSSTLWNVLNNCPDFNTEMKLTTPYSMKQTLWNKPYSMKQNPWGYDFFFITWAMPWCSVPPRWWGVPSGLFLALKKVYLTTHGGREAKTQPRHRTAIGSVSGS